MKTRHLLALFAAGILVFGLVGCSDDDDCTVTEPPAPEVAEFVGSVTCGGCHETKYNEWFDSGHPYKLNAINGGDTSANFPDHAEYPNDVVDPPLDYTWDNTTYTVGGFGWKIRWIDENGYMVTSGAAGDLVQYNFETDAWVTYTSDELGTKPYNCGQCHNTGWVANPDPEDLTGNQDGLPGMHGTFAASGIHCEQCHGFGSLHADDPENVDLTIDRSSAACGECHTRDAHNRIAASGGWVKHHEQYDEWLHSPHFAGPGCNDCHDPHASVIFDDVAAGTGMIASCTDCHDATEYALVGHSQMPGCTDCHMPKSSKSATVSADNPWVADVHSHILAINTDAIGKTEGMFTEDGSFVRTENGQAKITLDFACYGCHKDADGNGGVFSEQSLQNLSDMADGIHTPVAKKMVSAR